MWWCEMRSPAVMTATLLLIRAHHTHPHTRIYTHPHTPIYTHPHTHSSSVCVCIIYLYIQHTATSLQRTAAQLRTTHLRGQMRMSATYPSWVRGVLQCVAMCCSVLQCVASADLHYAPLLGTCAYTFTCICNTLQHHCNAFVVHCSGDYLPFLSTQCFAVFCSVLKCVLVCCSMFQFVAVVINVTYPPSVRIVLQCVAVCCSVVQCVAVCCSVLQCVAVCCSVLQCVAAVMSVTCPSLVRSVLQCVAGCCSVLQCVAGCCRVLCCNRDQRYLSLLSTYMYAHIYIYMQHTATHCNTLHYTATHSKTAIHLYLH